MRTRSMKCAAMLAAVVVVQVGLGGPASAAKGATLREAYVGVTILETSPGFCRTEHVFPTNNNVGKVCFTDLTTPGKYKVTVLDVTGQDVGFLYYWDGDLTHVNSFACKTVTLTRPPGASRLAIYLDGFPLWSCGRYATKGEVTLTTPR